MSISVINWECLKKRKKIYGNRTIEYASSRAGQAAGKLAFRMYNKNIVKQKKNNLKGRKIRNKEKLPRLLVGKKNKKKKRTKYVRAF